MQNKNTNEFTKVISGTEAKYRYWQIHKGERDFFPEKFKPFKIKFMKKVFDVKVNNRDCIMTGLFHYDYTFKEGDVIKLIKISNDNYELKVN
jgi:hypothetical protein